MEYELSNVRKLDKCHEDLRRAKKYNDTEEIKRLQPLIEDLKKKIQNGQYN